ncbi:MAG: energy-coupling factor ABC transporter permease [Alphaproteobacteria bacterium]|nr:energy-coupling factor ABC transporter permease [Alphaproteobacteria bacterium]
MHIPDGFVSWIINAIAMILSVGVLGFSVWHVKREFQDRLFAVPLLATVAAFVFAAQLVSFPIGEGTSGHFLGAVTAAALLGPWGACIVISVVLVAQGLIFGDGGISALGSNILNMGIIGGVVTYPIMRWLRGLLPDGRRGYLISVAVAGWLSVVLTSSACALELAASGTSPLMVVFPAMVGIHAIIGIGEAIITVAVLSSIVSARPDIIPLWSKVSDNGKIAYRSPLKLIYVGLVLALALAMFGSPFESKYPDGLEKVAVDNGFIQAATDDGPEAVPDEDLVWDGALLPDYKVDAIKSEKISASLGGLIGTIIVFGFGFSAIRIMVGKKV